MKLSAWTGLLECERSRPSLLAKYQFNCVQHQLFASINSVHFELIFFELANSDGRLIIKCQQRQLFGKLQFVKLFSADKATTGHCEMLLELAGWLNWRHQCGMVLRFLFAKEIETYAEKNYQYFRPCLPCQSNGIGNNTRTDWRIYLVWLLCAFFPFHSPSNCESGK